MPCPNKIKDASTFIDSAPRLGVYYFLSLTLYVGISVCHAAPSNRFFFFDQGPSLVAMATTFALGEESNRLPACYFISFTIFIAMLTNKNLCESGYVCLFCDGQVLYSDNHQRNADVELQQRSVEYMQLSRIATTDVLVDFSTLFSAFCSSLMFDACAIHVNDRILKQAMHWQVDHNVKQKD